MARDLIDEQINVFVILKTSSSLTKLQNHLPHLTLNLEVQAFGSEYRDSDGHNPGNASAQTQKRDVIWAGPVDMTQRPVSMSNEEESTAVWGTSCFLSQSLMRKPHDTRS